MKPRESASIRHRHEPAQPASLSVAVELWTFAMGAHQWSAALQAPGRWGFEVHILRNGKLRMSRRFTKRSQAVAWAKEERTALAQAFRGAAWSPRSGSLG
jgi:hypothetical protein